MLSHDCSSLPVPATCPAPPRVKSESVLLIALCVALPPLLEGLAAYARVADRPHAALAWTVRQAGLMVLGALELATGRPRTYRPTHLQRKHETIGT